MESLTETETSRKMLRIRANFYSRTSSNGRALEWEVAGLIPGTGQILIEVKVLPLPALHTARPSCGSDDLVKWRSLLQ